MMSVFRKPKTFKLRALHSQQKFGVAGKSCQEVLRKGCLHFQLPVPGSRLCLYEDGTEVTGGYFWSVPDNSELVLLTEGQTWEGYVSDISRFLSVFHKPHVGVIRAARQLLSDEQAPLRQKLLADLLHTISENIAAETRAEDPPWFEGLESRFRSKCSYLRFSCESRIRSYLREVNAHASAVGAQAREEFAQVVDAMGQKLRAAQYNGCYFDRGAKAGSRLCTPEGWFSCQGPFDAASCASRHSINPYGNRESRVLFSTWNLDHVCPESGCSLFGSDVLKVAQVSCSGCGPLPPVPGDPRAAVAVGSEGGLPAVCVPALCARPRRKPRSLAPSLVAGLSAEASLRSGSASPAAGRRAFRAPETTACELLAHVPT